MRPAVIAIVLALGGCHAFYQVRGTVRSCDGQQPIADAEVVLQYPGERGEQRSETDGRFQVAVNDPPGDGEAELVITAPGYQAERRVVRHGDDVEVCLRAEPGAGPPAGR